MGGVGSVEHGHLEHELRSSRTPAAASLPRPRDMMCVTGLSVDLRLSVAKPGSSPTAGAHPQACSLQSRPRSRVGPSRLGPPSPTSGDACSRCSTEAAARRCACLRATPRAFAVPRGLRHCRPCAHSSTHIYIYVYYKFKNINK